MKNLPNKHYRVLFTGKNLRQRRKETIQYPPPWVTYVSQHDITSMRNDYQLTWSVWVKKSTLLHKLILRICSFFQVPNIRYLSQHELHKIDLVHTPWQLLLNNVPYVVEVDNVWCLWMYDYSIINWFIWKTIIRYLLRRQNCRRIVCISDAAKASVVNFFHDEVITNKCVTSYPYVSEKSIHPQYDKTWKMIKLLFISSDFYLKWWREVVKAYSHLVKKHNISLYIITKKQSILPDDFAEYTTLPNIHFIEWNLSKERLYEEYYLTCDIFVLPTYMDSFWLVFLEAISSGLAVITTRMFATPEMVIDGENWYLLESPLHIFLNDYTPNPERWGKDIHTYCREHKTFFAPVAVAIQEKLSYLLDNPQKIVSMKKASLALYYSKFAEWVRTEWLLSIYQQAIEKDV